MPFYTDTLEFKTEFKFCKKIPHLVLLVFTSQSTLCWRNVCFIEVTLNGPAGEIPTSTSHGGQHLSSEKVPTIVTRALNSCICLREFCRAQYFVFNVLTHFT